MNGRKTSGIAGRRAIPLVIGIALSACLSLLPSPVLAQEEQLTTAEALENTSQSVAEIRRQLEQRPESVELWQGLLMMESMRSALELRVENPAATADERRARGERVATRVLAEWMAAMPESAAPWLLQANRELDGEARDRYVIELARRFPDDPDALSAAARVLRRRGEGQAASELLEDFVLRRPELSRAHALVVEHHLGQGNHALAKPLLESWVARFPDDPEPVTAWLRSPFADSDPEAMRAVIERFAEATVADGERLTLCTALLSNARGAYRPLAKRCLRSIAEGGERPELRERAAAQLARAAGLDSDWELAESAVAQLTGEAKVRALLSVIRESQESEGCQVAVARARRMLAGLDLGPIVGSLGSWLKRCSSTPDAAAWTLELAAAAPPERVIELLRSWGDERRRLPTDELAAMLERRLGESAERVELWRALDLVYQSGDLERRREHLERWLASPAASEAGAEVHLALASLVMIENGAPAAIARLERVPAPLRRDARIEETLLGLYLMAGETEKARALGAAVLAAPRSGSASGHLLLARTAWATGDTAAAAEHYRAAITGEGNRRRATDEYLALVAETGDEERLLEAFEWICSLPGTGVSTGSAEECVADRLVDAGLEARALGYLSAASERAPESSKLLQKLARAADRAGEHATAESAWQRLIALDPESEAPWNGLAAAAYRRGDRDELEGVVAASQRQLGRPAHGALRLLGKLLREQGEPERSVEILAELAAERPQDGWLAEELRLSYLALGARRAGIALPPAVSEDEARANEEAAARAIVPQAAAESPAAEGGEDSPRRLLQRADALYAALDGSFDLPAARRLYRQAAASGDALAELRLAGLLHLGNADFEIDRAAADRLARRSLPRVEELAKSGDAQAQYLVGLSYLVGIGIEARPEAARVWLERADAADNPFAGFNLGWMYRTGTGVAQSPDQSQRWYRRAAELGHGTAMFDLGVQLLEAGKIGGLPWLAKAAERGNVRAQGLLGNGLLYGKPPVPANPRAAIHWLERSAQAGDSAALFDLGWALLVGRGVEHDPKRAAELLRRAAENDQYLAMFQLGWAMAAGLLPGDGVEAAVWIERAREKGLDGFPIIEWNLDSPEGQALIERGMVGLEARAAAGDPTAAAQLAWQTFTGSGAELDARRAIELARPAAEQGSGDAMRLLGQAALAGRGMSRDPQQALWWWQRGADQGHSYCMLFLSQLYFKGEVVPRDYQRGLRWLRASGEAGNYWAWLKLGSVYAEGHYGVAVDIAEAGKWKRKAAAFGDEAARGWLSFHGLED